MDELRRSKYISLTTYRKDGTAVPTPVWHVVRDEHTLLVVTPADSWKVKRLRADPAVTVTACDVRGRIAPGASSFAGTARLLDEAGTEAAQAALADKYVLSRIGNGFLKVLRIRKKPNIGIEVTL